MSGWTCNVTGHGCVLPTGEGCASECAFIERAAVGGADQEDAALACAVALTRIVGLKQGTRDDHYDEQKPLAWAAAEAATRAFYLAHRDLYQDPRCPSCRQPLGITGIRRGICDTHDCDRYMTEVYDDGPAFASPGAPSTDPAPEPGREVNDLVEGHE